MSKYRCTECGGESDKPKVCETEGCAKEGEALTPVEEGENGKDEHEK